MREPASQVVTSARKGELNVDIQNMFNTLCRVAMLEDVLGGDVPYAGGHVD